MPNKEQQRLKDAIADVRKTFFPRWDKDNQWVIAVNEDIFQSDGVCNNDTKKIYLKYVPVDHDKLYLLLIHEICHAIVGPGHNKKLYSRIRKSAELAKRIGQTSLYEEIKEHVDDCEETPNLEEERINRHIELWLMEYSQDELREVSYEAVIYTLARDEYSMKVDEFEHRYPRCKIYFEKAKREREEEMELQKSWQSE